MDKMKNRIKKSLIIVAIGVVVNVALALIKMYVGLSSNSLCIMLDAINNFFDILTAIVAGVAFCTLLIPRSEKAPYGYGRTEYLAGFIVEVTSVVAGGLFFIRSLNRMAMPEPVWFGVKSCILISATVPVKLGLGLGYYFADKKMKSPALKALAIDSFMDVGITVTSVVSFAVSAEVDYAVDAIVGIVISVAVVVFAIKAGRDNIKAVVSGDGAKDEKEAIYKECEKVGVTVVKTELHDYGYGAKVGVVIVEGADESQLQSLSQAVKDDTGAEVRFIIENHGEIAE